MTFTRVKPPFKFSYFINSTYISSLNSSILDLGFILTHSLDLYIEYAQTLDFVKHVAHELKLSFAPLKALYFQFVRLILEYESILWDNNAVSGDTIVLT